MHSEIIARKVVCQAKFEVENTGQCHGPSGGVDSSADSAKVSLKKE